MAHRAPQQGRRGSRHHLFRYIELSFLLRVIYALRYRGWHQWTRRPYLPIVHRLRFLHPQYYRGTAYDYLDIFVICLLSLMAHDKPVIFRVRVHIRVEYVVAWMHYRRMAPCLEIPCEKCKAVSWVRRASISNDLEVGPCPRRLTDFIDYEQFVVA